jgi:DNA-binding response OmpR family regulator
MDRSAWLAPLAGQTIFVAEDEALISFDIEATLTDAGASVVMATDQRTGLAAANDPSLTAAVLDVRLGRESVDPICESLDRRWVPFLFLTGDSGACVQKWAPAPILSKPFDRSALIDGLVGILVTGRDALDLNDKVRIDLIIFRAQIRLAKQERLLEDLTRTGRDTRSVEGLLRIMRESVELLQTHRRALTGAGEVKH